MATQITLINGGFQDPEGHPIANGSLLLWLSTDSVTNDASPNAQVFAGIPVVIPLDVNGNVVASPAQKIWSNAELTPAGTWYKVQLYSAPNGTGNPLFYTPQSWVFTQAGGSNVDLSTMVPTNSNLSFGIAVTGPTILTGTIGHLVTISTPGDSSVGVIQDSGIAASSLATTSQITSAVAAETSRAEAAEALLAPIASPSFTGNATIAGDIASIGGQASVGVLGVPVVVYKNITTGLTGYVANSTVFTTTAAGLYRVSGCVIATTLSTTTWELNPSCTSTGNGATNSVTQACGPGVLIGTTYSVGGTQPSALLNLASGATIGISTVLNAGSNTGGVYTLAVTIERIA
jgi:hypothetical protein